MGFQLALILDCMIVGGFVAWISDDGEWVAAIFSSVICTAILGAVKWLFCDGVVRFGFDFFLILIPLTLLGTSAFCDDSSSVTYSGGGSIRSNSTDTEYTVYWIAKGHVIQIFSGESVYGGALYEIDMREVEKANASLGYYVYIRDALSGEIAYTLVPGKTYGNMYVVKGSSQYGMVAYTVNGEYICEGEDNLNYHVLYRIRESAPDRKLIERYSL